MKKSRTEPAKKGIHHHAKRLYHLTPKFVHGMVAGAFVGIVVVMVLNLVAPAAALSITSPRDCDSNAVINCGALTTAELQQRYSNKGVAAIYNYFDISANDNKATPKTAVAGRVYKNGDVTVNGTVVATKAITAGRENISGSKRISSGGATFYTREPNVSFRVQSIAAFVVMEDGQFAFAILGACGNPVKATPVPKKATTTKPVVTPPEDVATANMVPSTQTPESSPTPVVVASISAAELPHAGPNEVVVIGLLSIVGGYVFHVTHRHVRRRRHARS